MNNPFNTTNSFGGKTPPSNSSSIKTPRKVENFFESFKEQGNAATTGVANNAMEQLFGTPRSSEQTPQNFPQPKQPNNPNQQPFNFAEFLKMRENRIRSQERNLSNQNKRQETVIFNRKEEQAKKQLEEIQKEIKEIIKATAGISVELEQAEKTVMSTVVEGGIYYVTFFQRIRRLLALTRKRLNESQHWLEMFNSRKKAKGYYWKQAQKSGSKFTLSQERYMVTQTG